MTRARRISPSGPDRPAAGPLPFAPVSNLTMLAMVARTGRHTSHPDESEIASQFGWRFNGSVSRRMDPQLGRLKDAGLIESRRRPGASRGGRHDEWTVTAAGHRHLDEERDEVGELPERREHRLWRICHRL